MNFEFRQGTEQELSAIYDPSYLRGYTTYTDWSYNHISSLHFLSGSVSIPKVDDGVSIFYQFFYGNNIHYLVKSKLY
jgi:hypothetical protein